MNMNHDKIANLVVAAIASSAVGFCGDNEKRKLDFNISLRLEN